MDFSKRTQSKTAIQRQPMNLFTGRTKFAEPFGWSRVDHIGMAASFMLAGQRGATLSMAPGNGGVGVTVRIYQGEKGDYAYAADVDQLNEIFELLIAGWGGTSEDVRASLMGLPILPGGGMPAD